MVEAGLEARCGGVRSGGDRKKQDVGCRRCIGSSAEEVACHYRGTYLESSCGCPEGNQRNTAGYKSGETILLMFLDFPEAMVSGALYCRVVCTVCIFVYMIV